MSHCDCGISPQYVQIVSSLMYSYLLFGCVNIFGFDVLPFGKRKKYRVA
jgi:hypothetical protein